jgi:hypothetical protein
MCFVRQLAHYVDSLLCYLGWLWPIWDAKRQTSPTRSWARSS